MDGIVESIITTESPGWAKFWRYKGEGVMLVSPAFGGLFAEFLDEDLVFVRRKHE